MKRTLYFIIHGCFFTSIALAEGTGQLYVLNKTQRDLQITVWGDGCDTFDEGEFTLVPCDTQTLKAGEVYHWNDLRGMSNSRPHNTWVVPVASFGRFSLNYVCKVGSKELSRYVDKESNQLSVRNDHYLILLPGYSRFPKAYLDCSITTCLNAI